jgi:DNA helicase II / ATP-dependent DNA helicase PcrA
VTYILERPSLPTLCATPEQEAIIDFALHSTESMVINALAGSAKTTTLEFICAYLPVQPILSLAFNTRIAKEMETRLPGHVKCKTLNSVGYGIWRTACPHKLVVQDGKGKVPKMSMILKGEVDSLPYDRRSTIYDNFNALYKATKSAKAQGYVPKGAFSHAKRLITREDFYDAFDEPFTPFEQTLIDASLITSISQAYAGTIDFDDQIYMPTLFGGSFPKFPLVMVDEAQDLSPINHAMLKRLVTRRLIAVGDPWQSIYAFRGALSHGMRSLCTVHSAVEFPLSVSFRCPRAIVEAARVRAPHMRWMKPGGHVETLATLSIGSIPDNSAIICRNNAPLFRLALLLLGSGRGVHLVGTDLGPSLIKVLKKLGPPTLTQEQTYAAIEQWKVERLSKSKAREAVNDKAECLKVFAEFGTTLGGALTYAEHLFRGRGTIQLLTGHKAKGLEWDVVYHLDPWRCNGKFAEGEAKDQEANLRYVITTRAKERLFHIDLDNIRMDPHAT